MIRNINSEILNPWIKLGYIYIFIYNYVIVNFSHYCASIKFITDQNLLKTKIY